MRKFIDIIDKHSENVSEGNTSFYGIQGAMFGLAAGIPGALWIPGPYGKILSGIVLLGAAIGAWIGYAKDNYEQKNQIFQVYKNGIKISDDYYNYVEASQIIVNLSKKDHDPNTYYSIVDTQKDEIVWRFTISDQNKEEDYS